MKFLVPFFIISACATHTTQLSDDAKNLEVYPTKPFNCRVVGKVVGVNEKGSNELALNDALNQAANLGATGLYINQEVPNGNRIQVHATAYNCD